MRALLGVIALIVGCDSKAKSTDPAGGGGGPEAKSKEYESCGASMHCADDLRCLEQTCRRVNRSPLGDYNAALGASLVKKGDLEAAIEAYARALARYDADKLPVPPDLDCAYGHALAAARANPKHADLAAKVLHRCVLAVPGASAMRFAAFDKLVTLADSGLDPQLLGGSKLSDLYMTKKPAGPATDKLTITVTPTPQPTGKNWPKVPEKITGDLRSALISCWEKHQKKDELTANVTLKIAFYNNPDFEDEGGWSTKVEAGTTEADTCIKNVLEPAIKGLRLAEAVNSRLAITIK